MTTTIIYILSLILRATIQESVIYTPGSLSRTVWQNKGKPTDKSKDITDFAAGNATRVTYHDHDVNSLCWPINNPIEAVPTIINYNIDSSNAPSLTMEVWIYPTQNGEPNRNQHILGSENGGWQRGIIMVGNDGIVLGTGNEWTVDKAAYPEINTWTHIVGTWDDTNGIATIYVNGGSLKDGIGSDTIATFYSVQSSGNHNTNTVLNFGGFTGCIGRVEIIDTALTAAEVVSLYDASFGAFLGEGGVSGKRGSSGLGGGGGGRGGKGGGGVIISSPNQTPSPVGCDGCAQMYCCSAAIYNKMAIKTCPIKDNMLACVNNKNVDCQWNPCTENGDCTFIGSRKKATDDMKMCKTYMSISACESHEYCVWSPMYGMKSSNKFLNDMDDVFAVDINGSNGSEYRNIKIYGLMVFIFIGVMFLVYYFCKCNESKGVSEEHNVQVVYGSV